MNNVKQIITDDANKTIQIDSIQKKIFTIRGVQVMLDSDLAKMYQVETRVLNQAVSRNIDRFPEDFMFQLTTEEWGNLKSQNVTSSWGGRRKLPYVFTEQGISSLSGILKSETAVKVNIAIMRAFVQMRKLLIGNAGIFQRLSKVELKQLESDKKIAGILKAIEDKSIKPKQGIFYDGQVFDAYLFVADLIKTARRSIILIDNYIDAAVLTLFTKRNKSVRFTIYTKSISKQMTLDLQKHNAQYPSVDIKEFKKAHDRFLIIDKKTVYHFGASLKDLGKKWFAFSKMEMNAEEILAKLPALSSTEMENGAGDK
ncbi:MAG: ORF6N domain-containing protein [Candidatus Cloacimonadales bacterium]